MLVIILVFGARLRILIIWHIFNFICQRVVICVRRSRFHLNLNSRKTWHVDRFWAQCPTSWRPSSMLRLLHLRRICLGFRVIDRICMRVLLEWNVWIFDAFRRVRHTFFAEINDWGRFIFTWLHFVVYLRYGLILWLILNHQRILLLISSSAKLKSPILPCIFARNVYLNNLGTDWRTKICSRGCRITNLISSLVLSEGWSVSSRFCAPTSKVIVLVWAASIAPNWRINFDMFCLQKKLGSLMTLLVRNEFGRVQIWLLQLARTFRARVKLHLSSFHFSGLIFALNRGSFDLI